MLKNLKFYAGFKFKAIFPENYVSGINMWQEILFEHIIIETSVSFSKYIVHLISYIS